MWHEITGINFCAFSNFKSSVVRHPVAEALLNTATKKKRAKLFTIGSPYVYLCWA